MKENLKRLSPERVELVASYVNFARRLARQFHKERHNCEFSLDDYEGEALLGLCDAARRFDEKKGINFRTFAYFRIRGAMYDLVRRGSSVGRRHFVRMTTERETLPFAPKYPEWSKKNNSAETTPGTAKETLDDTPLPYVFAKNTSELAQLATIIEEAGIKYYPGSEADGGDIGYLNQKTPEVQVAMASTRRYLLRLIETLPEREKEMIERRYYADESFEEIREDNPELSRSWASRIHMRALDRLREMMVAESQNCVRRSKEATL